MHRTKEQFGIVTDAAGKLQAYLREERSSATSTLVIQPIDVAISNLTQSLNFSNHMVYSGINLSTRSLELAKANCDEVLALGDRLLATQEDLLSKLDQAESDFVAASLLERCNNNQRSLELNAGIYQVSMVGHDLLTSTIDSTLVDALRFLAKLVSQRPGSFDFVGVLTELVTEVNSHYARELAKLAGYPQYSFLAEAISPFAAILTKFIERKHVGKMANEYLAYLEDLQNALAQWSWAAKSVIDDFDASLLTQNITGKEDPCQT